MTLSFGKLGRKEEAVEVIQLKFKINVVLVRELIKTKKFNPIL